MFVERTKLGKVTGVYACEQDNAKEELPDDHPDVLEYLTPRVIVIRDPVAEIDALKARIATLEAKVR